MATKLDQQFVKAVRAANDIAKGGFDTLVNEVDRLETWVEHNQKALKDLMMAYERMVRSQCTPEQLETKPWECWEYVQAQKSVIGALT